MADNRRITSNQQIPASGPEPPTSEPGCVARAVGWAIFLLVLRASFAGGLLAPAADALFRFVFGRSFGSVLEALVSVTVTLGMFALLAQAITGDRAPVFRWYVSILGKALCLLPKALAWCFAAAFYAVEGRPPPSLKPGPGPRGGRGGGGQA